jgi:hypothetical protein
MRNPTSNGIGDTVTVNGRTAKRTRRAGSAVAKRNARQMKSVELRDTVLKMYLERVSQLDIGRALNLSQGRISQILKEAWEARQPDRAQTIEHARERALMENDLHLSPWIKRARSSPRAAEVLLSYLSRADRIQGLYQQHTSLSVDGRSPRDATVYDLTLLDLDQLNSLEAILSIAAGVAPPEPMLPLGAIHQFTTPPAVADWGKHANARIDDQSVVATVNAPESLRDRILKLHRDGLAPSAIIESLQITHELFIKALENPDPPPSTIQ